MQHFTKAFVLALITLVAAPALALPDGIVVEQFADGLLFPVSMAPTPDGDILVNEKLGTVRLIRGGEISDPIVTVDPELKNEAGLIGIELMPDWATNKEFLITYTPAADLNAFYVSRYRLEDDGTATEIADPWLELPSRPDTDRHYGGNIRFHDDKMYVAMSDLDFVDLAQDPDVLAGSILRYNLDLSIPDDNPIPGSPVWAYGLRNTFDIAIAPDGTVWGGENGHHQHDELNRLVAGGNYGFPVVLGRCDHYPLTEPCGEATKEMIDPVIEFKWRTAPTGIIVYSGTMFPQYEGDIFMSGWHTGELHLIDVNDAGTDAEETDLFFLPPEGIYSSYAGDERAHFEAFGSVDVAEAADGSILVLMAGMELGKIYRITSDDAVLDANMVRDEGNTPRAQIDAAACSASRGANPGALPLILIGFVGLLGLRRRRRHLLVAGATAAVVLLAAGNAYADVEFGGKAGGNLTLYSGDNNIFMDPHYGANAGATVRWMPIPFLSLNTDLLYVQKGVSHKYYDSRTTLHTLTVPLLVEGRLPLGLVALRLNGGVIGSVLLAARANGEPVENLKTFDYGVGGGLGVDISLLLGTITIDGRYERSLTTIYDESKTPDSIVTPTNFQNVIYVMAGFLY